MTSASSKFGPESGFHLLKDEWGQKSFMGSYSQQLAEAITEAIEATRKAVPVRRQGYQLSREIDEQQEINLPEAKLERAMFKRWNQPDLWAIPGAWNRIVAYQVPLYAAQEQGGWGAVDLLGMNPSGIPVVIELKRGSQSTNDGRTQSTETPLRMVMEGLAYAIAIKNRWQEQFKQEWINRLSELDVPEEIINQLPDIPQKLPVVAAAPASFWMEWLPITVRGRNELSACVWESFSKLLYALDKNGFPVSFVSISGHELDINSLGVQPLDQFPQRFAAW